MLLNDEVDEIADDILDTDETDGIYEDIEDVNGDAGIKDEYSDEPTEYEEEVVKGGWI